MAATAFCWQEQIHGGVTDGYMLLIYMPLDLDSLDVVRNSF